MESTEKSKSLKIIFGTEKTLTIGELKSRMKFSEITVRRKLKKSKAVTSYNKNGRFYTLPHMPKFDTNGLWMHNGIRFSKHGNMNQTIVQLTEKSANGLRAKEIEGFIGYASHSLIHKLIQKSEIHREKLQGSYVYFSVDELVYQKQKTNRAKMDKDVSQGSLTDIDIIGILTAKIQYPESDELAISARLIKQGVQVNPESVAGLFRTVGDKKKTTGSG